MPQPPDPPARASPAAASASATPQHHNQLQHQQPHDRQQHHHHHYPQPQQQHQQQQYSSQYAHYATPPASVSANSQPTSINGLPTRSHQSPHPPPITPAFHHHHPPPPQQQYAGSDPARHTSYGHDSVHGGSNGHPGAHKPLYPLQPQPQQRLDNGSQKKEIKRRTKTGCLTCRRRRIKCDEGQPTCGNCRKSKRECLGYDPIFKSSPLHSSAIPSLQTYPQGLSSPAHHMQQPIRSPLSESRSSTHHLPPPIGLGSQSRTPPPPMPPLIRAQSHGSMHDSQMEQSLGHGSHSRDAHYSSTLSPMQEAHVPGLRTFRRRKAIAINDLLYADGVSIPPATTLPPAASEIAEVMSVFRSQYSGMLDSFFETQWYSQAGDGWLRSTPETLDWFVHCNKLFRAPPRPGTHEAAALPSLEARLLWLLAELPRAAWASRKSADAQLADLLHRLDVVEHLLIGAVLPPNLIPPAPAAPQKLGGRDHGASPEYLSHSFWHHLGCFCAADDISTTSPLSHQHQTPPQQLSAALLAMRQILSVLENRDVLYSIAVARHYGGRLEHFDLANPPAAPHGSQDTEHPLHKLNVALRFLADEEHGGTTAVVRAMAGIARRGIVRAHEAG